MMMIIFVQSTAATQKAAAAAITFVHNRAELFRKSFSKTLWMLSR